MRGRISKSLYNLYSDGARGEGSARLKDVPTLSVPGKTESVTSAAAQVPFGPASRLPATVGICSGLGRDQVGHPAPVVRPRSPRLLGRPLSPLNAPRRRRQTRPAPPAPANRPQRAGAVWKLRPASRERARSQTDARPQRKARLASPGAASKDAAAAGASPSDASPAARRLEGAPGRSVRARGQAGGRAAVEARGPQVRALRRGRRLLSCGPGGVARPRSSCFPRRGPAFGFISCQRLHPAEEQRGRARDRRRRRRSR